MDSAREAIKFMENVVLPFTEGSMAEYVLKMKQLFFFLDRIAQNTIEEQSKIADWLIQIHIFKGTKLFLVKVLTSYPSLFTPDVGDEIYYDPSEFFQMKILRDPHPKIVGNACCFLLNSLLDVTDKFEHAQKAACSDGLVHFLVTEVFPLLHDVELGKDTLREELLNRSLDLVYNCCKVPSNRKYYEEANAVDALLKIREKTKEHQNEMAITALLALGYLLDDSNNDQIISGQGTIRVILENVTESLNDSRHISFGFHLEEFLTGLSHLAVNDENKDLICDEGGIAVLAEVLEKSHDDKELIASCNALWLLCFCKKGASLIGEKKELKNLLSNLKKSKNTEVQRYASGVLWQLENTEKKIHEAEESSGEHEGNSSAGRSDVNANTFDNATNQHIMISYQWDNQQMAKRIADYLKGRGFKVWIDIYEMKGYIMDDMATAVENSALLLVCLSRRYKNSPNTRRECDYAFQLRKDFIPLMMEENYKPDGWLGILLGTKLWTDFTNQSMFDSKIEELLTRLGSIFKTEEPVAFSVQVSACESEKNVTDDHFHGQHHPIQQHDVTDNRAMSRSSQRQLGHTEMTNQILGWGNNEVTAWLRNKGIMKCMKRTVVKKIDGLHLVMLYKLYKTNAGVYYENVMPKVGDGDVLDMLSFGFHLEELFETMPAQ